MIGVQPGSVHWCMLPYQSTVPIVSEGELNTFAEQPSPERKRATSDCSAGATVTNQTYWVMLSLRGLTKPVGMCSRTVSQ